MSMEKCLRTYSNLSDTITDYKCEFNSDIVQRNIREANENASKNIMSALNLIADQNIARLNVMNDSKVKEFLEAARANGAQSVRAEYTQDRSFALKNGFDAMDNDGNFFTANELNMEGYQLDHILPYAYLLDPANEDLLADIVISYNGDIDAAFNDIMTKNPKTLMFVTQHVNGSKGGRLGSSESSKYNKLTEEQKKAVREAYAKREEIAKQEATKNTASNKFKTQLKETLKNMLFTFVAKLGVKIIINKIMEITGELMIKNVNKKWHQVLKDACGKDAIKKACRRYYDMFKNAIATLRNGVANFIESFKDGKSFARKIGEGILTMLKKAFFMGLNIVLGISKLVLKAIQLGWSILCLIRESMKLLKESKKDKNYIGRFKQAKEVVKEIVRVIVDAIDFAIELVITVFFAGVVISQWVGPVINIVLVVLCTVLTFTLIMFIDSADAYMVNSAERFTYVSEKLF